MTREQYINDVVGKHEFRFMSKDQLREILENDFRFADRQLQEIQNTEFDCGHNVDYADHTQY